MGMYLYGWESETRWECTCRGWSLSPDGSVPVGVGVHHLGAHGVDLLSERLLASRTLLPTSDQLVLQLPDPQLQLLHGGHDDRLLLLRHVDQTR